MQSLNVECRIFGLPGVWQRIGLFLYHDTRKITVMTLKAFSSSRILLVFATTAMMAGPMAAEDLTPLMGCKLMPTAWADGDSFLVQAANGATHTIRLYGADCFEWHVTDETDARRLRAQRRYFGISEFGGAPQASIDAAKALGQAAAEDVVAALAKPFTVHTAFADARGDGKHKRVYGFVTTADGEDLAERLVRLGLARAFGVYRETPAKMAADEYRAQLQDIELLAAKRAMGAWSKTNWDRLAGERLAERKENTELDLATARPKLAPGRLINPNTATRDDLMKLPGIGEVTATRIINARPFKNIRDLRRVEGMGNKTLERIAPFLKIP
jgi:competence protein ComEA